MPDDVVAFALGRYLRVPERLAGAAGDLDDAVRVLGRVDHAVAPAARGAVALLATWTAVERVRASARVAQLLAIPGIHAFSDWNGRQRAWRWSTRRFDPHERTMLSPTELEAIAAHEWHLADVVRAVEEGDVVERDDVEAALATLEEAAGRPDLAASLLDVLGADGFRHLHAAIAATAGDLADEDAVRRLEDDLGVLTATFATASRAVGRHRLPRRFLDDLLGPAEAVRAAGDPGPDELDGAQQAFTQLDFGREVAERLATASRHSGTIAVLERAGRPFVVLTMSMPLVDLLQHGPMSSEFVASTASSSLNLMSFLATGTVASAGFFLAGALVAMIAATADDPGTPRRPTRGGASPTPGSGTSDLYLDDHGVPVPADGS